MSINPPQLKIAQKVSAAVVKPAAKSVERATAQVTAPTANAVSTASGLVWHIVGVVIALALLLLVLRAAESGNRLTQAVDWATGSLRKFVNPFGDAPGGSVAAAPKATPTRNLHLAAQSAVSTTNPHAVRLYA